MRTSIAFSALIISKVFSRAFGCVVSIGLRRIEAVGIHILARHTLELWRLGRAHQVLVVKPLHEERQPSQSALDPHCLEFWKPLGKPGSISSLSYEPCCTKQSQRVHAEKAVDGGQRRILPVIAGMKRQRLPGLLDHRIKTHVFVAVNRLVASACHAKADNAFVVAGTLLPRVRPPSAY